MRATQSVDEDRAYRRLLGFIVASQPVAALLGGLYASYFMIYATDVLLVAPVVMGTLIALARIYDGASDLAVGSLGDRLRSRHGRRRPFIMAGSLFLLAAIGLWLPPSGLGGMGLVLFLAVMLLLLETGRSMVNVSIGALGVEVARTPQRRTFTNALAGFAGLAGTIGALMLMQHLIDSGDPRSAGAGLFVALPLVVSATFLVAATMLREVKLPQSGEERPVLPMLREVLAVGYHRQLLGVQMAEVFAYTSIGFAAPYVMRYVLGAEGQTSLVLIAFFVAWHLSPFGWLQLVPRMGMKRVWEVGQWLWLATFASVPLLFVFGVPAFIFSAMLGGIATGASTVSYAMLGDLADYDAKVSGRQRQGIYMTIYLLVGKIAAAVVAFLLGVMLQVSGFVPNAEQGATAIAAMMAATTVLPAAAMAAGLWLLSRYRFYEEEGFADGRRRQASAVVQA